MPETASSLNIIECKVGEEIIDKLHAPKDEMYNKEINVKFKSSFKSDPNCVSLSVLKIDAKNDDNVRYDIRYKNLNKDGFTLWVGTWGYTKIHTIKIQWTIM